MNRGYSRCSTNEGKQDINRQVRELKAAGAEMIYMEYEHGDAKVKSQGKQLWEEIDRLRADMTMLSEEDIFIYGFRLGARMILDVVGDYKGQFYETGEAR